MPEKPEDVERYLAIGCGRCKFGGTPECKVHRWETELRLIRGVLRQCGLTEEIKWSIPCYTHGGRNILSLSALKESAVLGFFRGAELSDPDGLLEKPGNNSRFARYMRFTDAKQITSQTKAIRRYVKEAIEIEASGKPAASPNSPSLPVPDELAQKLSADPEFESAFSALTPGRRRGYLIHFSSAKQSKTRIARIEKLRSKILQGKGWNER